MEDDERDDHSGALPEGRRGLARIEAAEAELRICAGISTADAASDMVFSIRGGRQVQR